MMKVAIFLALVAMVSGRALDDCATCKLVVSTIDTQLKSNTTIKEIEDTVNKICDAIPGISDECKQYVGQYVPEIVNMIAAKITPKQICDELHLCNNSFMQQLSGGLLNLPMGPGPVILSPQEDVPLMVEDEQQHQPIAAEKPAAGEFCTICEFAISKVEQELQANATEAEIIATVEKICDILPATVKDQCKTLIESEGPQIINLLISKANPETICTAIGLCTNASLVVPVVESVAPVNAPEAGPLCTICEFVISKVEAELGNNSTEAQIIAAIEKVCSILPKTVESECKQLIDQLGPEIINLLINKAAPEVICTAIHACTGSKLPRVQQGVSDKPYCQVCEQVMTYVQSLLKQNSTVEEVEQLIDNICDYLPGSYQNQCKDLVDQYAPQIIAQLAAKVNPDQICAEIQLCTDLPQEVMPVRQVV